MEMLCLSSIYTRRSGIGDYRAVVDTAGNTFRREFNCSNIPQLLLNCVLESAGNHWRGIWVESYFIDFLSGLEGGAGDWKPEPRLELTALPRVTTLLWH